MYLDPTSIARDNLGMTDKARLARVEKAQRRRVSIVDAMIGQIPKLDVAGSIPVSRSILSMTCRTTEQIKSNRVH